MSFMDKVSTMGQTWAGMYTQRSAVVLQGRAVIPYLTDEDTRLREVE